MATTEELPKYEDVVRESAYPPRYENPAATVNVPRRRPAQSQRRLPTVDITEQYVHYHDHHIQTQRTPSTQHAAVVNNQLQDVRVVDQAQSSAEPPPSSSRIRVKQFKDLPQTVKRKMKESWSHLKQGIPGGNVEHAPDELQQEIRSRRRRECAKFIGFVILTGVVYAVIVLFFTAIIILV
ncbi:hypothetical protein MIR68_008638 [Amoeboaphelidium protococcarum]|nr:hypothetical protein MIR68_008638 [Amoeboaphelidium protococcarum]